MNDMIDFTFSIANHDSIALVDDRFIEEGEGFLHIVGCSELVIGELNIIDNTEVIFRIMEVLYFLEKIVHQIISHRNSLVLLNFQFEKRFLAKNMNHTWIIEDRNTNRNVSKIDLDICRFLLSKIDLDIDNNIRPHSERLSSFLKGRDFFKWYENI